MDSNQILAKETLNFHGLFRETTKILTRNPKFISLLILISFPLFCSSLTHDFLLHPTLIQLLKILPHLNLPLRRSIVILCPSDSNCFPEPSPPYSAVENLKAALSPRFLVSWLLISAISHILDLLFAIIAVYSSAIIYGGNARMGMRDMLLQPLKKVGLKRPLITWLFAILLASLTLLGLISLSMNIFLMMGIFNSISASISGFLFVVLFVKYIEWSAVWNLGIVGSILDKNHGYIAIGVAGYLSRGRRRVGLWVMVVFIVVRVGLRLVCVYVGWERGSCGIWGSVVLGWVGCVVNGVMWVVFMVYFYDCKKGFLEKKVDMEDGKNADEDVQEKLVI